MTMLDDDIDDLLGAFRADEGVLDDVSRQRMWDRVERTTGARSPARRRRGATPARRRGTGAAPRRLVAMAAALLVAVAAGVVVGRATGDAERVTVAPADAPDTTTTAQLPTMNDLAAAAGSDSGAVVGSSAGAAYAHVITSTLIHNGEADAVGQVETWVAVDGSGRRRVLSATAANADDTTSIEPDAVAVAGVPMSTLLALPRDPDQLAAALAGDDPTVPAVAVAPTMVDLLAQPGLPAATREALFEALASFGYRTGPGVTTGSVHLRGPGGEGIVVQAEVLLTGTLVTSRTTTGADGTVRSVSWSQPDLRPSTS